MLRGLQHVELVHPPGRAGVDADMHPRQGLIQVGVHGGAERRLPPVRHDRGALGGQVADQALAGVVQQLHAFSPSR